MADLIDRQAAIDIASGYCHPSNIASELAKLPSAQPEYTEHEKTIMTMLFGIVETMLDVQGGYMDIYGESFSRNDLFDLSEKLGIEDY